MLGSSPQLAMRALPNIKWRPCARACGVRLRAAAGPHTITPTAGSPAWASERRRSLGPGRPAGGGVADLVWAASGGAGAQLRASSPAGAGPPRVWRRRRSCQWRSRRQRSCCWAGWGPVGHLGLPGPVRRHRRRRPRPLLRRRRSRSPQRREVSGSASQDHGRDHSQPAFNWWSCGPPLRELSGLTI